MPISIKFIVKNPPLWGREIVHETMPITPNIGELFDLRDIGHFVDKDKVPDPFLVKVTSVKWKKAEFRVYGTDSDWQPEVVVEHDPKELLSWLDEWNL